MAAQRVIDANVNTHVGLGKVTSRDDDRWVMMEDAVTDALEVLNTELQDHKVYFVAESDATIVSWISSVNTPMLALARKVVSYFSSFFFNV